MGLEIILPTTLDEWHPIGAAIEAAFAAVPKPPTEEEEARSLRMRPLDFRVGVRDGEQTLGGCLAFDLDLTMPGGAAVPAAGLAGVGIDPTQTGRGGLRMMMHEHLRLARDRGLAASTLLASESSIYGRFGYGPATTMATYEIDSAHSRYREPLDDPGSLEMVGPVAAATDVFETVYAEIGRTVAGTTSRSRDWWDIVLGEKETWLGGGEQLGVFHRNADGVVDGYALYRVKNAGSFVASDQVRVSELLATTRVAELRLFEFLSGVALTRSVRWLQAPVDTPVRHHLLDRRQLRQIDVHDLLWVRPIDVRGLLEARSYLHDGSITIAVDDDLFDDQRGPWTLSISEGRGSVVRADAAASVEATLSPGQLGAVLLGDTRVLELAAAGVLRAEEPAARQLDQLLLTERRPFTLSKF